MKYFAMALALAALAGGQSPVISISPNTTAKVGVGMAGVPVLGYLVESTRPQVRSIFGTAHLAQLGGNVDLPKGIKRVIVPPRELYLLVESADPAEPLAMWSPEKGASAKTKFPNAIGHPDGVYFSPRGDAAVLTGSRIQVIRGLPGEPVAVSQASLGGDASRVAVSDDGSVVVAQLADGSSLISRQAGPWLPLPLAFGAQAMSFVPNTHNLVLSDHKQRTLALIEEAAASPRILAQDIDADRLAFTKEGDQLLAASTAESKIWAIDLHSGTGKKLADTTIDRLLLLRDGHSFLTAIAPVPTVIHIPVEGDRSPSFVSLKQ